MKKDFPEIFTLKILYFSFQAIDIFSLDPPPESETSLEADFVMAQAENACR